MKIYEKYYKNPTFLIKNKTSYQSCDKSIFCENEKTLQSVPNMVRNVFYNNNSEWVALSDEGFMSFLYWTICYWYNLDCGEQLIEQILNLPEIEGLSLVESFCNIDIKTTDGKNYYHQRDEYNRPINFASLSLADRGLSLYKIKEEQGEE